MTDAATLRNADELWALVRLVREAIEPDGTVRDQDALARMLALADECED